MSNVGYATLTVIPSMKGFSSALGGQVTPATAAAGRTGGAALGGGLVAAATKFAGPLAVAFGLGSIFKSGFGEAMDAAAGTAQLAAGIKSTGNAANVTVGGLNDLASKIQLYSGQTDDSIVSAQKLLLTFTNIKNEGPDKIFDRATIAASDMAARMGGDASDSAIQLGKALNDPIGGIASLSRVGVQFTDAQKASIKAMVESGDVMGAQKVILGELETQFGGSAKAAGESFPGQVEILKRSFEDFSQMIVGRFLPSLGGGVGAMASGLQKATPIVDAALGTMTTKIAAGADIVKGAFTGAGSTADVGAMTGPLASLGTAARDTFQGIIAAVAPFAPTIASAFGSIGPQIAGILPLFNPLGLVFQALLPVLPQIAGLIAGLAAQLGPLLGSALAQIVPLVGLLVSSLSGVFAAILPIISGMVITLGGALTQIIPAVSGLLGAIIPLVMSLVSSLLPIIMQLVTAVLPIFASIFGSIVTAIAPLIQIIQAVLVPVISALLPVVSTVFGALVPIITAAMTIVQGIIQVVTGIISGNWDRVWAGIGHILSGAWNLIKSVVTGAIAVVASVIGAVLSVIGSTWNRAWSGIASFLGGIWSGISSAVSNGINGVVSFMSGLAGKALSAVSSLPDLLVSTGRNMIEGLMNGIQEVAGNIAGAILNPVKDAVAGVKNFLGIKSPSRLFMQIGGYTGEGMAIGLRKSGAMVQKASDALIPTIPSITAPDVGLGLTGALAAATANTDSARPIVMDGTLFGWLKQLANGEAQIVINKQAQARAAGFGGVI